MSLQCADSVRDQETAVAMLVNAGSSNHEPNQEADRDPKRLSESDSLL